jgi:DNA-binding transcriptional LysR family regulator
MISRVLSQEADLGFGSDIGQKHSELATEPLFSERMALFVRDDHPLAQRVVVDARHLESQPFIHVNPDANVWRAVSRQLSSVANVYPQVGHHVSMLSTAFGLIQAGAGVALLPRYVEVLMPANLRAVTVTRPTLEYPVVAVRLAKHPLSPAALAFLAMARQHMKPPRLGKP